MNKKKLITKSRQEYIDEEIMPALNEIEEFRSAAVQRIKLTKLGTRIVFFAHLFSPFIPGYSTPFYYFFLIPVLWFGGRAIQSYVKNQAFLGYHEKFKKSVIEKAVRFFGEDLQYDASSMISREHFISSGIYAGTVLMYSGDDRVYGQMGQTSIDFSEMHVAMANLPDVAHQSIMLPSINPSIILKIFNPMFMPKLMLNLFKRDFLGYSDIPSDSSISNDVLNFHGLFFAADFHKNFKCRTYVLPDLAEKKLGSLIGQSIQSLSAKMSATAGSKLELVKMESAEFEKEFAVYSDDQIGARYILSPAMMERILDFKRKSKTDIKLSFVNSFVYIAIPSNTKFFEPPIYKPVNDPMLLKSYFDDLELATGIVNDLNLNTRIWSKK